MGKISRQTLHDIKETARDYMYAIKGHHLTENDVMIAENLIMFGYIRAKHEKDKTSNRTKNLKEKT